MSKANSKERRDRGERPSIDPVTGEVRGSGAGAGGGGSPSEDYGKDSAAGASDDPAGGPRPIEEAARGPVDRHET